MLPSALQTNKEIFNSIKQNFYKHTKPQQVELRKIKVKIMDDAVKDILHEWKYETITLKQLTKELRLNGFKVNSREVSKAIQRLLKNGKALRIGKRTIKLFKR